MLISKSASSLTHCCPVALSFADDNMYNKRLLSVHTLICFAYVRFKYVRFQNWSQTAHFNDKIPIYSCDTFVLSFLNHSQVFSLSCLCADTILLLNLLLKHLLEV